MSPLPQFPTVKINFGTAATSNPFRFGVQDDNGAQYKAMEPARMDQNLRRHLPGSTVRVKDTQAINLGTSIVSVQIVEGDTEQTVMVHEALLGDRSKCLQSILSEMHSQDSHKIVAFKDVDPQAFALYIQYLYTGHIPSKPSQKTAAEGEEYSMLCKLYVFAFKQEDITAQNAACDAIYAKAYEFIAPSQEALPRNEHIRIIYNGTSSDCAARRLLLDVHASQANRTWMRDKMNGLPPEFTCDLAR
ncbi:hypothetical protein HBH56_143180 [Parastagonospora nodorum]|uniref:BTB domain-containing protein n=1 Tax=Phaeosphaeria nodorum (strain SN15 / ATCC MYA-4574 / FGSC 10173) TaxID=321614 RepID=A0A7U2I6D0_PHANO|nr:hypothetical protein HBH56_143180 [Parastagonospora nodorum]QRD01507.1 hypothetical protein JI435_121590 [Parastagonospora nodorum SN15]KAH3927767.1 hypothetical protein HBH54_148370 [Parastagonospora nodorum]KAH3947778.1 hypothetical protein HBH53_108410 [Parastagonospora nodorum]KAH3962040.1 hypothetical protein HBH51_178610 [Parastagonospora nodorum]